MIICTKFKPHVSGMLIGFADFFIDKWRVELHGCGVFQKGQGKWVMMPSREWKKEDGETGYTPIMSFPEEAHQKEFRRKLLAAYTAFDT